MPVRVLYRLKKFIETTTIGVIKLNNSINRGSKLFGSLPRLFLVLVTRPIAMIGCNTINQTGLVRLCFVKSIDILS